jgi:hypothetical protein
MDTQSMTATERSFLCNVINELGSGGNLILCHACFAHENRYRYNRGVETKRPNDWPQVNWAEAEIYNTGA